MRRAGIFRLAVLAVLTALPLFAATALAQPPAPDSLSGLVLGSAVKDNGDRLEPDGRKPLEDEPWLERIRVKPDEFFGGGYVMAGSCAAKGRILRIKLKYRDETLDFFRKLIGTLLNRYGNPAEYKGDLGGEVMGNKWSFTNKNGESISLIVQRAQNGDPDITQGTVIKLANQTLMEAERSCYGFKHPEKNQEAAACPPQQNFEGYLPQ